MRNALFNNCRSFNERLSNLSNIVIFRFDDVEARLIVGKRVSMHGSLRDEAVWHWKADNAGDEGGTAEEEEIPMEASGFLERELAGLSSQTRHIMVVVKQQHSQEAKRQCHEDPSDVEIPKVDHPVPRLRGLEGLGRRHECNVSALQVSWNVRKAHPEERRKDVCIVCEDAAEPRLPDDAAAKLLEAIYGAEIQYGNQAGEVAGSAPSDAELVDKFLNAFDCLANQRWVRFVVQWGTYSYR